MTTIPAGVDLPDIWQLASYKDILVRLGIAGTPVPVATLVEDGLWSVPGETSSALYTQGRGPITTDLLPVLQGNAASAYSRNPDAGLVSGRYVVTAIENVVGASTGSPISYVLTKIYDLETGQVIVSNTTDQGCVRPRVVVKGSFASVVYIDQTLNKVAAETYDLDNLDEGTPVPTTIFALEPSVLLLDAIAPAWLDDSVLVAYVDDGDVMHIAEFSPELGVVLNDSEVKDTTTADVKPEFVMSFMLDFAGAGLLGLCFADATSGLVGLWNIPVPTGSPVVATATTILDNSAEAKRRPTLSDLGIWNVTSFTTSASAAGVYTAFYDIKYAVFNGYLSAVRNANKTASGQASGTQARSMSLRSEAFARDGYYYVLGVYDNFGLALQQTYFLLRGELDAPVAPLATVARWQAGGATEEANGLGSVLALSDDEIYIPVTVITSIETGVTIDVARATQLARLGFITGAETELSPPVEFLDWLLVPGGTLMMFDGTTYCEVTFANRPEPPTPLTPTAGGSMEDGEHGYQICYSWTDATGRVFRSEPSVLTTGTTAAGNNSLALTFAYLHNTGRQNVVVEIYRAATGTSQTFNRVVSLPNDPLSMTGTYTDTAADATIAAGVELYTDGGGLGNQTIPGARLVAAFDGRVWIADGETLWYSNQVGPGDGIVFNDVLTLDINDARGAIRSMSILDDKLIVTKDDGVYVVTGQGPNGQGQGGSYTPSLVAAGVGCSNPKSVAVTQDGVWINSTSERAGIHTVSRGLSVEYTGAGVRRYVDEVIVSAVVVAEKSQIRWFTESGRTFVWDWISKLWATNTEQGAISAAVNDDVVYYACGDASVLAGCVLAEDPTTYAEGTREDGTYVTYPKRVKLPWLIVSALQGFVLVDRCQGVGDVAGAHVLVGNLYRNYDDGVDGSIGGFLKTFEAGDKWDWELLPRVKKVASLMLELVAYDASMITPPTAGPIMEAAVFTVGILGGLKRQPNTARMKPY